ncbi:MAG: hypothetical protein GF334_01760, partial [Candidatus Altiarchaeales archaeon]|nr:hypothetical protein [Candidatus Altiarchaeales archaeon]
MYDENVGWAVGDNGVVLKTTDGGNNWNSISVPVNTDYKRVKFVDLYTGYMVGRGGTILKSNDSGESWFELESSSTDTLNDLAVIDAKTAVFVGDNGTVLLTIDGTTIQSITETGGATDNVNGVYFFDTSVGWAVGDNGLLLITKDGGRTWTKYAVTDLRTMSTVTQNLNSVAFYNMNDGLVVGDDGLILRSSDSGYSWVDMSDRIWSSGSYQSMDDLSPSTQIDFARVFIKEDFPVKFTIAVYPDSRNYFTNITYEISPSTYPNSLVLRFTGTQDGLNYVHVLDLDNYADADALKDAINQIVNPYLSSDASLDDDDRTKVRVFEATIEYESFGQPSDFRPTSGSITGLTPAQLSFSVEDKAWIVGNNGTILTTSNSGSKWEPLDLSIGYDLKDTYFLTNTKGWFAGSGGAIVFYDPANLTSDYEVQDTDLTSRTQGRIFPQGNIESESDDFLNDNIILPDVGVETTKRVQVQYRIRIVDGVDPFNYPESGLGMPFVYSLGPNSELSDAGSYTYTNMGETNGDYGVWRARCRNTVDGYSWAVPMFFVTRRNSSPFNVDTNINGSTYFDLNAIRPDGLTYEEIAEDDVIDVRRMINVESYSALLEKNLDKVLGNRLKTNMSDKDQQGLQYGVSITAADTYQGENNINSLVRGGVSSTATIVQDQKTYDPNIEITESELTFGPLDNGLYHNDPAYYTALVVRTDEQGNQVVTNEPVAGDWEGLGTDTVKFTIAENFLPEGADLTGVTYQFTAHYLDYSGVGLSKVPNDPIAIKYRANSTNVNQTYYYNGINARDDNKVLEYLSARVTGYPDYVEVYSAKTILDNVEDQELYEIAGNTVETDADFKRSLRKFEGQQFRGSLVLYHYYFRAETALTAVRVPKNVNNYSVFAVREVRDVNGTEYKISTEYADDMSMRDRETVDGSVVKGNLVIYLDSAFTIPSNNVVEVVLEVMMPPDDIGYSTDIRSDIAVTVDNSGENQGALRTSLTANYNVASKGIGGMYVGVLYPLTVSGLQNEIEINLASSTVSSLEGGTILGLSSNETKDSPTQMYIWYKASDPAKEYYTSVPVSSVEGLGTSSVTIYLDERKSVNAGQVLVPMIVKQNTLQGVADTSIANVFYKYRPYQPVGNLPTSMTLEIMKGSDFVYVSNLGTGASNIVQGEPYEIPVEQIAVNDESVVSDNMFSNIDDIDFANFSIDTGFIKIPATVARYVGEDITLSNPNNIGDRLGRPFYAACSEDFIIQGENLVLGTPRKVFVPMIGRIRSNVTSPFLRGEIVLLIFSKVYKARLENKTGFYEDQDVEYQPGYYEEVETAVSVYRLTNKPLVRK